MDDKTFQPSGIERHPVSGNYFVVAARQHAIAEITPEGQVVAVMEMSPDRHPQAEGITFTPDYDIIISDEGKDKRARLPFIRVQLDDPSARLRSIAENQKASFVSVSISMHAEHIE